MKGQYFVVCVWIRFNFLIINSDFTLKARLINSCTLLVNWCWFGLGWNLDLSLGSMTLFGLVWFDRWTGLQFLGMQLSIWRSFCKGSMICITSWNRHQWVLHSLLSQVSILWRLLLLRCRAESRKNCAPAHCQAPMANLLG